MQNLNFTIEAKDSNARAGTMFINGNKITTPTFMPVATRGAIKGLPMNLMRDIDSDIILCNTYHLLLKPGSKVIEELGGIHKYIDWNNFILTDSGGFQAWSLGAHQTDEGIYFKSIYDGSNFLMTPEISIKTQEEIGSNIAMVLDSLVSMDSSHDALDNSINRTYEWSSIAKNVHSNNKQSLFGIIQGGISLEHREKSINNITGISFDGYAIGGLSVGEDISDRIKVVDLCVSLIKEIKPIYVMGLGDISGILDLIELGVDMFDCVWPTRLARHGKIIDGANYLNIKNEKYKNDPNPLTDNCNCITCLSYSRSYINHLYKNEETSSWPYLVYHNLYQTKEIIDNAREAILLGTFKQYKEKLKYANKIKSSED